MNRNYSTINYAWSYKTFNKHYTNILNSKGFKNYFEIYYIEINGVLQL